MGGWMRKFKRRASEGVEVCFYLKEDSELKTEEIIPTVILGKNPNVAEYYDANKITGTYKTDLNAHKEFLLEIDGNLTAIKYDTIKKFDILK